MEQLKPSEEEIIKLGKRIVEELEIEDRGNILGRWMAHYVAELIKKVEDCNEDAQKEIYKKECFEAILKLWKNKESVPKVSTPFSNLKEFSTVLKSLEDRNHLDIFSRFIGRTSKDSNWKGFMEGVRESTENVLELCLYANLGSDFLAEKTMWTQDFRSLLNKEELEILDSIESLINRKEITLFSSNGDEKKMDIGKLTKEQRYLAIFNKVESELEKQKEKLQQLKSKIL